MVEEITEDVLILEDLVLDVVQIIRGDNVMHSVHFVQYAILIYIFLKSVQFRHIEISSRIEIFIQTIQSIRPLIPTINPTQTR